MKKTAIIVAGGSGTRMGKELPKQFLAIHGKPVLLHSVDAFLRSFDDIRIVLVLPSTYLEYARELVASHGYANDIMITEGGETRFHSVQNGLKCVTEHGLVFVHDAVRCLVSPELIKRCATEAELHGSAIPVVPVRDSIRKKSDDGESSVVVSREGLFIVQTPQTFLTDFILPAFELSYSKSFTDEASVAEAYGLKVHLVEGEEKNIKITFPDDLEFAEWRIGSSKKK
ncbi:MAG: 2-C-methyl-D-erythritol 4-phosphate cytidylyltransferase [bacterium]|jgi:2-C-methyl-D-erythritol 4-phosphate cytidylyltransferase